MQVSPASHHLNSLTITALISARSLPPRKRYVDLWKQWSAKSGIKVKYVITDKDDALNLLRSGRADAVMGLRRKTDKISLSVPVYRNTLYIYYYRTVENINEISDLNPFIIGITSLDAEVHQVREFYSDLKFSRSADIKELVNSAVNGRTRVFIADSASAWFEITESDMWRSFSRSSDPVFTSDVFAAVRSDRAGLLEQINSGFTEMTDPEKQIIEKSWTGESLGFSIPWVIISTIIIIIVIISGVLISGYWNFQLQRKVFNSTEELRRSRQTLTDIVDSIPSILFLSDSNGLIIDGNFSLRKIISESGTDSSPAGITSILPFMKDHMNLLSRAITKSEPVEMRHVRVSSGKNTPDIFYDISIYPLSTKSMGSAVVRIDDVSENIIREEQLIQSQKMETVGTLAGGLAHDFNNVLAGIYGTVSLMRFEIERFNLTRENTLNYISIIEQSSRRAAAMVKQLLTLSRKHESEMEPCDLNKAVEEVVRICSNSIDKTIAIKTAYNDSPAIARGDLRQLEQVIMNLCINASHAMTIMRQQGEKLGGELDIAVTGEELEESDVDIEGRMIKAGPYWHIRVSDTGTGIPPEVLPKIFDPFFSTKDEKKGTGLGLSMVYSIIKEHNGIVKVASPGRSGTGTDFSIYLPAVDKPLSEQSGIKKTMHKGSGHIVFVDDEETIRKTVTSMLKLLGYSVAVFACADETVKYLKNPDLPIDAVLTDLSMPGMSGRELYSLIKKTAPGIPIGLTSGYRDDRRIIELREEGLLAFIEKPFSIEDLSKFILSLTNPENLS